MSERVISRRRPFARLVRRLPMLGWLTLVWIMLWGMIDPMTVVSGVLVALFVIIVFPLPPIITNLVVRPVPLLRLVGYLAWDMVHSTLRVSWQALRYRGRTKAGIVAVRMLTDSDHLIAMVANGVSLAPGKFVMQVDRVHRICYVYALGMRAEEAESVRREVLMLEVRVVYALGSEAEVAVAEAYSRGDGA